MATRGMFRAVVLYTSLCVLSVSRRVGAQACSISSTTRGPLSCAVTTAITTTIHMPALVSVTVTPLRTSVALTGGARRVSIVDAALEVSANRSYSLQIADVPEISDSDLVGQSTELSGSIASGIVELNKAPALQAMFSGPVGDHAPLVLAFSRRLSDTGTEGPIRLVVTIAAP